MPIAILFNDKLHISNLALAHNIIIIIVIQGNNIDTSNT